MLRQSSDWETFSAVKQLCGAVEAVKDLHCISVTDIPFTRCPTGGKFSSFISIYVSKLWFMVAVNLYSILICWSSQYAVWDEMISSKFPKIVLFLSAICTIKRLGVSAPVAWT